MNSRPALAQFFIAVWLVFNAACATADNTSPNIPETGLPGMAYPHTETLQVLREEIDKLESQGVALITVARLIELQNRSNESWHAFLSP